MEEEGRCWSPLQKHRMAPDLLLGSFTLDPQEIWGVKPPPQKMGH